MGLKVMSESVAFDASIDAITKKYNAGIVYAVIHIGFDMICSTRTP